MPEQRHTLKPQPRQFDNDGDDLVAAHRFCEGAAQHIIVLTGEARLDHDVIGQSLQAIKTLAAPVQIRAVMRMVDMIVDMIKAGQSQSNIDDKIVVLEKLIAQYNNGLMEICAAQEEDIPSIDKMASADEVIETSDTIALEEPLQSTALNLEDYDVPVSGPAEAEQPITAEPIAAESPDFDQAHIEDMNITMSRTDKRDESDDLQTAFETARQTLAPLMPFMDEGRSKEALLQLSGLMVPAVGITAAIIQHQEMTVDMIQRTAFETLMPALTNAVLARARSLDKTVSISWIAQDGGLDDVMLTEGERESLCEAMHIMALSLVEHSLEPRAIRVARGEAQGGHIAVSLERRESDLILSLSCTGKAAIDIQSHHTYTHSHQNGLAVISTTVTNAPVTIESADDVKARDVIVDDVKVDDISARLSALLSVETTQFHEVVQ